MTQIKTYILQKDLPDAKAGEKESSSSLSDKDVSDYDDALNYYNQTYNPCQNQKQ